jgi:hypothetical protein
VRYLGPNYSAYHLRCANLIWALDECTDGHYVESIIAQSLTASNVNIEGAYDAFGVFWRLSGAILTAL